VNTGPGTAGLLWLWAVVAELGPSDPQNPPPAPYSMVIMTGVGYSPRKS
jgi:hypothetical protein